MELTVVKYSKYQTNTGDLITNDFAGLCKMFEKPARSFDKTLAECKADEATYNAMNEAKKACGGVAWGENADGKRGNAYVINRCAIGLDYDDLEECGENETHEIYAKIEKFLSGYNYLIYSTTKHAKNSPRLRIIIPTSRVMSAEEYTPVARAAYNKIGWKGADLCGTRPAQMMGFALGLKDSEYIYKAVTDAEYLDVDKFISENNIDIENPNSWAYSEEEKKEFKKVKSRIKAVKATAGDKPANIIDIANICTKYANSKTANAFNKAYTISMAIEKFVPDYYKLEYENGDEKRYSLTESSSKAGLRVTCDALCYSYHSKDVLADGHFHNAFDLVRIHLYSDLDDGKEYKDERKRASYVAMCKLAEADSEVIKYLYNVSDEEAPGDVEEKRRAAAIAACGSGRDGEYGLAYGMYTLALDRYVFAVDENCWYEYDGVAWKAVKDVNVGVLCDELHSAIARALVEKNENINSEEAGKMLKMLNKYTTRMNAIKLLREFVLVNKSDFDKNDYLVAMSNGYTIDLADNAGTIRKSRATDYITKHAGTFITDTDDDKNEEFDAYINSIFADEEVKDYAQRAAGYALSGLTSEKKMFVTWGESGNNGKSKFLEMLKDVWGDYAMTVVSSMLLSNRFGERDSEAASPVLADLAGVRLVLSDEVSENRKFDTATVKRVTGGAAIRARKLHKDSFEYIPKFKTFLAVNEVPQLKNAADSALRLRIRIIPFDTEFSLANNNLDYDIEHKIHSEAWKRACLRWAVEGFRMYDAVRLDDYDGGKAIAKSTLPSRMSEILGNYIKDSDDYGDFFETYYEISDYKSYVTVKEMYDVYTKEFHGGDDYKVFGKKLGRLLKDLGLEQGRRMVTDEQTGSMSKARCWFMIRRIGYGTADERAHDRNTIYC